MKNLPEILRKCRLCPRECNSNRTGGQKGICGESGEIRLARAALHMCEEPCISGKSGSGTVFFPAVHCTVFFVRITILQMEPLSDIYCCRVR